MPTILADSFTASLAKLSNDEQKQAMKEFGSADSGASLGDILGEAIKQKEDEGDGDTGR